MDALADVQLEFLQESTGAPIDLGEPESGADLHAYDRIVCAFSGGKDSVALVLRLLELGAPRERIELWHHDVDGREGSTLMDWPVTRDYVRAFAEAFSLPVYYSWRVGGIEGEMFRDNDPTGAVAFERPDGTVKRVGGNSKSLGRRLKWPAKSANLAVRWCSSVAKIDVMARAITNQDRFIEGRTLVVTGERAEESAARSRYATFEPHRTDNRTGVRVRRYVDHWRPLHGWSESAVWRIMERHRVRPAPPYYLGFSRLSCMSCIFLHPDQWATIRMIAPQRFQRIRDLEVLLDHTIDNRLSVVDMAEKGEVPDLAGMNMVEAALSDSYDQTVILPAGEEWLLPSGAYGDAGCGPS